VGLVVAAVAPVVGLVIAAVFGATGLVLGVQAYWFRGRERVLGEHVLFSDEKTRAIYAHPQANALDFILGYAHELSHKFTKNEYAASILGALAVAMVLPALFSWIIYLASGRYVKENRELIRQVSIVRDMERAFDELYHAVKSAQTDDVGIVNGQVAIIAARALGEYTRDRIGLQYYTANLSDVVRPTARSTPQRGVPVPYVRLSQIAGTPDIHASSFDVTIPIAVQIDKGIGPRKPEQNDEKEWLARVIGELFAAANAAERNKIIDGLLVEQREYEAKHKSGWRWLQP
jgi:hypothetical protein